MYCPQCGATNDDSAGSCSACDYDLSVYRQQWEGEETPQTAFGSEPAPEAAPAAPAGAQAPAQQWPPQQAPGYGPQAPPYQAPGYGQQPPGYPAPGYGQQAPPYQGPPYPQQPYQRYYPAPPYQSSKYAQGPYGIMPRIPSYLGWAIAVLIVCFWPTGIPAVVFASQVDNRLAMGDVEGAYESSRKAKMWCWISFGIAIAGWVLAIAFLALIVIVGAGVDGAIY